jgi:hypothetical protein
MMTMIDHDTYTTPTCEGLVASSALLRSKIRQKLAKARHEVFWWSLWEALCGKDLVPALKRRSLKALPQRAKQVPRTHQT